ncbi:MAG: ROK family protein [Bacillota bacterium]|nr:ROK family protein [Bacillota bacterium]
MSLYLGIDLGGTHIKTGIVTDRGKLIDTESIATPLGGSGAELARAMRQVNDRLLERQELTLDDIESIGVGSPGIVDTQTDSVIFAGNLRFRHEPLGAEVSQVHDGKPVRLVNDGNAAAYGESIVGSGRGASSLVMITLGTGIGGGIIINGHIITGYAYGGAELGHMVIDLDGRHCTCGRRGCFETYASATGLILTTQDYMRNHPETIMWALCGQSLGGVSGRTAFDAAREGDPGGKAVVNLYIHHLAVGLGNIVNSIEPEILCLGGGVSHQGDFLLNPLREAVYAELIPGTVEKTRIVQASLGNDAGIIGAALSEVWTEHSSTTVV